MKRTIMLMTAGALFSAAPAFAATHTHAAMDEQCAKECAMLLKDCAHEVDSIQQRISRLQAEIAKGTAVYSPAELQKLQRKLKETTATLQTLEKNR